MDLLAISGNPPLIPSWCPGDTVTVKLTQTIAPGCADEPACEGYLDDADRPVLELRRSRTGGSDIMGYTIEVSTDRGIMWTEVVASQTATTYSHTVASGVTYGTTGSRRSTPPARGLSRARPRPAPWTPPRGW